MTTLPGLASKGEKGKSKYQSLDINSLYRSSRGESVETHQQKNTLPRKHGMQILGRVPNARRPPANLPSLKSEHSGSDTAVSLVPSGGPGWGKQDTPTTSAPISTSPATSVAMSTGSSDMSTNVTSTVHPPAQPPSGATPPKQPSVQSSVAQPAVGGADKSWSAVMAGADHPPPYQSAQFQHEFPSLDGSGAPIVGGVGGQAGGVGARDVQYGPGPSLRPQTEGSWMQGGSRTTCGPVQGVEIGQGAAAPNSVQPGGPPPLLGPAGPPGGPPPPPAQFRGLLPPFMCRGNFPPNAAPPPHGSSTFHNATNPLSGRGRFPAPGEQRVPSQRQAQQVPPSSEVDDQAHRPIIKEEELSRMDDMTRDVGWASHDDIDYNQKLAFSDDEQPLDREREREHLQQIKEIQKKEMDKIEQQANENRGAVSGQNRGWSGVRTGSQPATPQQNRQQTVRRSEEEEMWEQRRRQQSEEVAIAVERAKLRKEEEEKRYLETKQAAAKKLQELEDKIKEKKGAETRESDESQGTINPSTVPPQPINPVPIPVPEWERDRESRERERSRTPNDVSDKQHPQPREADFRQLTQIEGRNFVPKSNSREISRDRDVRERDRDIRERDGPNFSRHFQSNLPPRFQKQQAERQSNSSGPYHRGGTSSSPQPQSNALSSNNVPFAQQYDPRWMQNNSNFNPKTAVNSGGRNNNRKDDAGYEKDREEDRGNRDLRRDRHTSDTERERSYQESNRRVSGENRGYDDYNRGYRREGSQEYEYKRDDEKWEKDRGDRHFDDRKDDDRKKSSQSIQDTFDNHEIHRQDSGEWRREKYNTHKESSEERNSDRQDNSQRPDSRDSRISKDSLRDDYACWADSPFEPTYEEKKKDTYREERRQVPGPITKDRIEADDLKSEKRNLIQLKRSDTKPDKKEEKHIEKKIDDAWVIKKQDNERLDTDLGSKSWADQTSNTQADHKFMEALEKGVKKPVSDPLHKIDIKQESKKDVGESNKEKDEKHSQVSMRGRMDSRSGKNWGTGGSGTVYHSYSWSKRGDPRSNRGSQRSTGHRQHIQHASDSEFSGDEISVSTESGKEDRSSKLKIKKSDKDDKNKDRQEKTSSSDSRKYEKRYDSSRNREPYVPRGEPSRHGRGGFRGSRSLISSKRIDGYGIPPSKSPFGNHDDKDKKNSGDEIGEAISSDEKTKLNQQALAAGIIGSTRSQNKESNQLSNTSKSDMERRDRSKGRSHSGTRKPKTRGKTQSGDENWETSDYSDTESDRKEKGKRRPIRNSGPYIPGNAPRHTGVSLNSQGHRSTMGPPSRNTMDKRNTGYGSKPDSTLRQNSSSNLRSNQPDKLNKISSGKEENKNHINTFTAAIENVKSQKENKMERTDSGDKSLSEEANSDEKSFDAEGFQEVKSKKNVKERQKIDEKVPSRSGSKSDKESMRSQKFKTNTTLQLTPAQIANIPPLLGTPVNPPTNMNTGNNKSSFERSRQNKLAPRFAKQRENRMQKQQLQGLCDVNEMNKLNQTVSMYNMKDPSGQIPVANAWEKPITSQLRNNVDAESLLAMGVENCAELEQTQQSTTSSQRSSPNTDKLLSKTGQVQDKAILDGATPPVNTIIFENTNYKSAPVATNTDLAVKAKFNAHIKNQQRPDKNRKLDETDMENSVMSGFNKPISDMLNKGDAKPEPIQMPLSFNKAEDNADMKLDFTFDSDLTQLTDDKSSKSLGLPRSMHAMTSAQSTISPSTADLNFKIASVKKVWETTMPTVLEHSVGQDDAVANAAATFPSSFGPDPNALDHSAAFSKGSDQADENHEVYSPSPNQSCTSNNTTNVCKVKPTQQLAGTVGASHAVSAHHGGAQAHPGTGHSAMVSQNLMGHPLSPPPMQVLGQPPQQYAGSQHINYQPSLGGSAQYGSMSAIPSPPNVLFNSTQQMQTQGGLYGPFQIDQSQVMNTQGRSQYSQYPTPYGLGQTASSPYSAQSIYLQTPPHPPPSAQPPPDIYQNISSQYRMAATGPFGQSQQLTNNPSTVLISSTSNSLMSATVKPSTQQISAIDLMSMLASGTKAGAVGQAYQQQSQQGQQLYIPYDPSLQANYMSSTNVLQRGPTGPVQNNVVPGLQPSSSYYSGSAGAQTGFYQQPTNSTLQSQLHQTSYNLQGNLFGTHNQSHASAGYQGLGSQFLTSPMQMAAAAALTAQQQYRSPNLPNQNYLKGIGSQHISDQSGRSQQLKSPGANQQDVLASVFNSAPQIPSPKSRQNCKQPPPQSSPTQHKYVSPYQTVNNQQAAQIQPRYPTPIQRPVNFQPTLNSSLQGSGNVGQRHRPTHNQNSRPQQRQYYGGQGGGMQSTQQDKSDDSKLIENGSSVTISASNPSSINSSNGVTKSTVGNISTNQNTDQTKESGSKDETIQNKE